MKGGGTVVPIPPSHDRNDLLWRQYALHVDLYKFYLELVLKANVFFYGITGAILSYYFTHVTSRHIAVALALPMLMSIAIAGVFFYGMRLLQPVRNEMYRIRDELNLENAPDFHVLSVMLGVFGSLLAIVAIGLFSLLIGIL